MTMQQAQSGPGDADGLAGYLEAMEADGAPVLGHVVLYSVFDGRVTPDDLQRWFAELGLNQKLLPPPIRPVDAFEKVTGRDGIRVSYPLDLQLALRRRRRRPGEAPYREAMLMVRHVRRDGEQIVRQLVRELRDEGETRLTYDTRLARCIFRRDDNPGAGPGAGSLHLAADHDAIGGLPEAEQEQVRAVLDDIAGSYWRHCTYLTGDRLRGVIRTYIESLNAIRLRPTGGVYFIHRRHAATLAALRTLVNRFGAGSHLSRVPLPDQDEMREMVVTAWRTKATDDLNRLARDIAAAQRDGGAGQGAIEALHKRFRDVQATSAEHAQLLGANLDDTQAALRLVNAQLASLLTQAS